MCPLDGIRNALCASLCNASIFLANAQRTSTSWVRGDLPAIPLKNPAHELVFEALDVRPTAGCIRFTLRAASVKLPVSTMAIKLLS